MEPRRLLIVEDEAPVAQLLASAVRRLGYAVVGITDSAAEGFRIAAETRPDLAVLDIELHGRTEGIDLARRLREELDIPSIFLTGRSDEQTLEEVHRSGSFGYLLKPFHPQELKACMELALQRHARESHLVRLEQALTAAVRCAADGVILVGPADEVLYLNPAAERLTGWTTPEIRGQPLSTVFRARSVGPESDTSFLDQQTAGHTSARPAPAREILLFTRNDQTVPVEVTEAPLQDEVHGRFGSVLVFRDITERKRYQNMLRESRQRLRALARNLETSREDERARIAREIHDELGQMLTKLKMDLAALLRKAAAIPDPACEIKLREMMQLVDQSVQTVRRISSELRPGLLDTLGLAAALEWEAQQFQTRTGIRCQVRLSPHLPHLDRGVATALFRIAQEALTNVARHAHATQVELALQTDGSALRLTVTDNGRGASREALQRPGCFGILGMRERVHALGGEFLIESQPGHGTHILARVPCRPESDVPRP